jgi:hypothetical protein
LCDEADARLCHIAVVFDLVLELVFFDEVVELAAESSGLVDVVGSLLIGEDVVDATRLALFFVAALQALVLGLLVVSRRTG